VLNSHAALAAQKSLTMGSKVRGSLTVFTDRLKLERVLNNLMGNAIKFTNTGSVRIEVQASHENVEIHVIDTGIGIAPEHMDRLFDEFFQVQNHERDRQKGFGLGLAISRRLVRQLHGDLRIQSTPGLGSCFTILLPDIVSTGKKPADDAPIGLTTTAASSSTATQTPSLTESAASAAGGR
jgi:signal transduction histidine kinase